jgi:hypothetical protein
MAVFLTLLFRYVAPFVMGVCVAAAVSAGDAASISAVLGAGSLWFFSMSMRMSRKPRG